MSKDNSNLRLLGSPVNLFYRSKKKDDRKNIRNRPRSALQNSCFTPENPEKYKRPFSADAKEHAQSTRSFFKTFSSELLQSYNNNPLESAVTIKVLPPTTELLGNSKARVNGSLQDKEICSNASDYGSEDTFVSLGTKIKARAQGGTKIKTNKANHLKYRNIAKKNKKAMDSEDKASKDYDLEVKITERHTHSPPQRSRDAFQERSNSPTHNPRYESYFIPLDQNRKNDEALAGRVSFGSPNLQAEVEQAIDTYSRRLNMTRHQLSLVEEESTQDLESTRSQHMSSLSPENSLQDDKKESETIEGDTGRNTYVVDKEEEYPKKQNFMNESRTYTNFYDDFHNTSLDQYKTKLSSTVIHTDSSSKDSGYPESIPIDDKPYNHNYSFPSVSSSAIKKSNSHDKIEEQPKSLDSAKNDKGYKTYPFDKGQWAEPLNHSRLLYKDFFIKKEGHISLPPQNSPIAGNVQPIPGSNETLDVKTDNNDDSTGYPPYLLNSSTKAYTSKVIEDYKKELEAINNLHVLTLKDIKTDAVSPTPLNIDKMFEIEAPGFSHDIKENPSENSLDIKLVNSDAKINKNTLDSNKKDVSKVSTKELIQNYLKVKDGYDNDYTNKSTKRFDRKLSNNKMEVHPNYRQDWNNKSPKVALKSPIPVNIRNQTQRNSCNVKVPTSARLEDVHNDKDVDSWMSLSVPSPRIPEIDRTNANQQEKFHTSPVAAYVEVKEVKLEPAQPPPPIESSSSQIAKDLPKSKDLSSNSTVLDIYSMLKEIESFGDKPVTSEGDVVPTEKQETEVKEERSATPKDNFLEIFEFLEKVEQSANDAMSVVTTGTHATIPKLEMLLKLPQTELAQRLVTATLQLEERSCCIALLQESLTNHKEQMVHKVSSLEKQSMRNVSKVKQECEEAIKRHQSFIDQLINDKKTLNHRIEQLVDERRSLEERWKRSAQALEERYKLELRNQHDKMVASQQVARQRWVRQKAEKIKELTVKGLEGELREMAERQQKELADLKMFHAEHVGRMQSKHSAELEELRRSLEEEKEAALVKERQLAASRMEKQILELEVTYQEQRTRLVAEMRAENERVASGLSERERHQRQQIEKWKEDQEKIVHEKKAQLEQDIRKEREKIDILIKEKQMELEQRFELYKKEFEVEQQMLFKKKVTEISAQHKQERDRDIEKAIESMEAEAQAGRRELQEALRRNKEQYETELQELAETEQATLRRYQDAQARVRGTENRCAELEVMVNQLETRNKVLTEKNTQLEAQGDEIRARCEQSWQATVQGLKREMEDLRKTHEEQMHQLYAKVKVAVARKDSAIQALTRESAKYQEKVAVLEQKLQQQRKDFLKQK